MPYQAWYSKTKTRTEPILDDRFFEILSEQIHGIDDVPSAPLPS